MHNDALCFKKNGTWESFPGRIYDLTRIVARAFCQLGFKEGEGVPL